MRAERIARELRRELSAAGDRDHAVRMQSYMKSQMPFVGVKTPDLRGLCKRIYQAYPLQTFDEWRDAARLIWDGAVYREERHAAIALTKQERYDRYQLVKAVPLYEHFIVSGAWWDLVDAVAPHRLGEILMAHPAGMTKRMQAWARARSIWKRRAAIICQLGFKGQTDEELLFYCADQSLSSREFFLRKAIGWALRQYARTAPESVLHYVRSRGKRLSALSRREALKHFDE